MKGNSPAVYRFHRETTFAKPPVAIWPFVSDSARLWELGGMAPYRFEERVDGEGRVRRFVRGKVGAFPGAMGGGIWRMAGEPPPFPGPKLPKRSNAPLGMGL